MFVSWIGGGKGVLSLSADISTAPVYTNFLEPVGRRASDAFGS
jgi:hypothetical protein